ncbi:flagellar hook-basal body protein [Paenibacillus sp. N1-5-1-14]|uniref:flagellar hook-basal body protein n=1 Tax=Paenibacillus radicibacter TaxID=2972488 RepID=UPI002158EDED|nr:flagellar hook-basal body protein [Paenibacillus radicibacter]MCR8645069.1 flagellar hook-basal body protein [Paenibacillus radicibacter]
MNHSMINSSVSLHGLQQKLDILAGNIANVNTTGYKKTQASFEDVLTRVKSQPEDFRLPGRMTPLGLNQGYGARLVNMSKDMSQGSIQPTDNPLDFAVEGNGMFEIGVPSVDADGNPIVKPAWTKNGSFTITLNQDREEVLTTKEGYAIYNTDDEQIIIPTNHRVQVDSSGRIYAYDKANEGAGPIDLGQMRIVRVVRPQLMRELADNLYELPAGVNRDQVVSNVADEDPLNGEPIRVMQGFLEHSNVKLTDEMSELIMVQRAFQLNSRAISSSDTMMGLANNLRG